MICSNCKREIPSDSAFCPFCAEKTAEQKYCRKCGTEIPPDSILCPVCGVKPEMSTGDVPAGRRKSRTAAAVVIAVLSCLLIACAVWVVSSGLKMNHYKTIIESQQGTIDDCKAKITELEDSAEDNEKNNEEYEFFRSNAVIVAEGNKKYYHRYGCKYTAGRDFRILNTEAAEYEGYIPCPTCCK